MQRYKQDKRRVPYNLFGDFFALNIPKVDSMMSEDMLCDSQEPFNLTSCSLRYSKISIPSIALRLFAYYNVLRDILLALLQVAVLKPSVLQTGFDILHSTDSVFQFNQQLLVIKNKGICFLHILWEIIKALKHLVAPIYP